MLRYAVCASDDAPRRLPRFDAVCCHAAIRLFRRGADAATLDVYTPPPFAAIFTSAAIAASALLMRDVYLYDAIQR